MGSNSLVLKKKNKYQKYYQLFLMLISGLVYYFVFHYVPIFGISIAFSDFSFRKGIFGSPFVGFKHFIIMWNSPSFKEVFLNTLILGILKLVIGFPIPVIFAVLLNEIRFSKIK